MSVQSKTPIKFETEKDEETPQVRNAGPLILIGLGIVLLLATWVPLSDPGLWVLPLMGLVFIGTAVYSRRAGFLMPGFILGGLGVGFILGERVFHLSDLPFAAVIVLSMAVGFALITIAGPLVQPGRYLWALIPAGILAIIGVLMFVGPWGIALLQALGTLWPGILIAIGIAWLWANRNK